MADTMTNDAALKLIAEGAADIAGGSAKVAQGHAALAANLAPVVEPPKEEPKPPVVVEPDPLPAMAKVAVTSLAELTKAAAAAKAPTQITLSSGKHGILTLKALNATALKLVLTGATLQGLRVQGCSNIAIVGARSILDGAGSQVQVKDSVSVSFTDCETTDGTTYGFSALNSVGVAFIRCRAARVKDGFQANGCDGLVIKDAHVRGATADGGTFAACSNVHIDGFDASDFNPSPGAHPDVIQFFTKGTTKPSQNILIENVRYVRGATGGIAQGIFITDQVGTLRYSNVRIRNCWLEGSMYNGIALSGVDDFEIIGNTIQPYAGMDSRIQINGSTNGRVEGNASAVYQKDAKNIAIAGNAALAAVAAPLSPR